LRPFAVHPSLRARQPCVAPTLEPRGPASPSRLAPVPGPCRPLQMPLFSIYFSCQLYPCFNRVLNPQPCVNPASTLRQPCVNPASTLRQPCVNPASTLRQPCVNPASTLRQPCVHPVSSPRQTRVNPVVNPCQSCIRCQPTAAAFEAPIDEFGHSPSSSHAPPPPPFKPRRLRLNRAPLRVPRCNRVVGSLWAWRSTRAAAARRGATCSRACMPTVRRSPPTAWPPWWGSAG